MCLLNYEAPLVLGSSSYRHPYRAQEVITHNLSRGGDSTGSGLRVEIWGNWKLSFWNPRKTAVALTTGHCGTMGLHDKLAGWRLSGLEQ